MRAARRRAANAVGAYRPGTASVRHPVSLVPARGGMHKARQLRTVGTAPAWRTLSSQGEKPPPSTASMSSSFLHLLSMSPNCQDRPSSAISRLTAQNEIVSIIPDTT